MGVPHFSDTPLRPLTLLLGLVACATEARVVEEMELALTSTNHAIAATLLLTELSQEILLPANTTTTTLRHAGGACPTQSIFADTVTLDFADLGCVPDGGLFPQNVGGHAEAIVLGDLAGGADVVWTIPGAGALFFVRPPEVAVTASVTGPLSGSAESLDTRLDGALDLDGIVVEPQRLHVTRDADQIVVDGSVFVQDHDPVTLAFDHVALRLADLPGPCPVATGGTVLADDTRGADVLLDFDAGKGERLDVTRRQREALDTDLCAYASRLL